METLKLELTAAGPELIVRQGAAAKLYDPLKVELAGTIGAPADYFERRVADRSGMAQSSDWPRIPVSHVVANFTNRTIRLVWDESNAFRTEVTGELSLYPALAALTINEKKTYTHRALLELLRYQRAYFGRVADSDPREDHERLMASLQKFDAKVTQAVKDEDDKKGKTLQSKLVEIEHSIPLQFVLTMPIFGGVHPYTFTVDIRVGLLNGAVDFWLESVELHELIITETESIFDAQLQRFSGIVIIRQY